MENCSLVLEGGGMRGVYTAGALEFFMEKNWYFPYVIGVSAGACHAMSYISKQPGRNKKVSVDMVKDPRYIRYRGIIDGTGLFNMDFIFDEVPNSIILYDYDTFMNTSQKFVIVATDCKTGEPVYISNEDLHNKKEIMAAVRASSSLPLVASVVKYKDKELLDGGLSDSIPIKKAISDGYEKNIVIVTRNKGYRKKQVKGKHIYRTIYGKKYPGIVKALENRYIKYNETLDYLDELENEGKAFVLYPSEPVTIKRSERDYKKLEYLYQLGYHDAKDRASEMMKYLNVENEIYNENISV